MPAKKATTAPKVKDTKEERKPQFFNLSAMLSRKPVWDGFSVWLVHDTPLITHAWSEKARRQMLEKQVKATKSGREARDPHADFVSSLYEMEKGVYGFPITGIKKCIIAAAHKNKGIAKTDVTTSFFIDADMVSVRPALAGAICDMPLVRVWGSDPAMREDMVKIGVGRTKTASLAYRAQFTVWAIKITGRFDPAILTASGIAFLILEAGVRFGLGEWRNERSGMFGAFHLADPEEAAAWDKFTKGGPIPISNTQYKMAA